MSMKFKFAIDRGGTFTDVYAKCPDGKTRQIKLLSVDPNNYPDAPREGIRRILQEETGVDMPPSEKIDGDFIEWIRMGTTVATNALLERKGEDMALLITKGFKDLLFIGNQARPKIFDLEINTPDVLYKKVVEVDCRVVTDQLRCEMKHNWPVTNSTTGEKLFQMKSLDKEKLFNDLLQIKEEGIKSIAVVLMHSYMHVEDELAVGEVAKSVGFDHVSLSHQVMPMSRIVARGFTACADAYLTPHIKKYVKSFASGFRNNLEGVNVLFMQSDGGLTPMEVFNGSRAILSGPAGGVVGYAMTTPGNQPVIGFDMGGTSTDVSRYAGTFEHVFESTTAGVTIQAPQAKEKRSNIEVQNSSGNSSKTEMFSHDQLLLINQQLCQHVQLSTQHLLQTYRHSVLYFLAEQAKLNLLDVNTVAAGGGSCLFFRSGLFVVGPDSAGAHPGPTCYRKGGPLTVTDANLCLGRLLPEFFPNIFGPDEKQPLDKEATLDAFNELTSEINNYLKAQNPESKEELLVEEIAIGFIRVANEAMCRPIRALTQAKGYDTRDHVLACFGGAGAQHACAVARSLGMSRVVVHKYAGILSAYGMALADVVEEVQEPCAKVYKQANFKYVDERLLALSIQSRKKLISQGFQSSQIICEPYLHLRYEGTDCALMVSPSNETSDGDDGAPNHGDFKAAFLQKYHLEFGFTIPNRDIIIDDIRIRAVGKTNLETESVIDNASGPPIVDKMTEVYFEDIGYCPTKVFLSCNLLASHSIEGPAIIIDNLCTILVEPDCTATVTKTGDIQIEIGSCKKRKIGTELDSVQLSIFSHRFMSIAEQMGRILQRTSISTNIKERLDFSCALFGPDGGLVSNAPHIPVHLGAMQETVQYQMYVLGDSIEEGDVILSNHPKAGGSHLPDLTVITPVFYKTEKRPVFFVASRGHHADIGGITPGSMPPHSKSLSEEGAAFKSFFLVRRGVFQQDKLTEAFMAPGKIPGSSGSRNLRDNIADLKAQIAANQKGIGLVRELIDYYGLDVVQAYMHHIQSNAELAVRDMLRDIGRRASEQTGKSILSASDYLDDGSEIKLTVNINTEEGSAVCDFTGTGYELWGNCNAPRAITLSALIYCLRCMVGHDVPLNQGCLTPVKVIIPAGSLLDPSDDAGVVGGNVQTSQRIVDVVFKAFNTCAASQGCMNNITFGQEEDGWGYYETVAGGAGAGPTWHGRSGVHTHMTNTRITDPEVLERRYPVILKRFSLRDGSGGKGAFTGGDGIVRELLFRAKIMLSVLTERRVFAPYGLEGGSPGAKGLNLLYKTDGRIINLGSKTAVNVEPGDIFQLITPGGGGWGKETDLIIPDEKQNEPAKFVERGSVFDYRQAQESV